MIAPFLLVALTHGYSLKEGVTPVQKVIQMLQEMSAKGAAEKAAEEKTFVQYKEFCITEDKAMTAAIAHGGEQIELLTADVQKAVSDSKVAAKKIAELDAEIAKLNAAKEESNAVAAKDRADYLKEHEDYSGSVNQLAMGIQQFQSGGVPEFIQGERREALLQLRRLTKMPIHAKRVLTSFLETAQEPSAESLAVTAPESAGYDMQTGGIVDMLKKLLSKFKDELNELEKEEMKRKGAHD